MLIIKVIITRIKITITDTSTHSHLHNTKMLKTVRDATVLHYVCCTMSSALTAD